MMQRVSEFLSRQSSHAAEALQPWRAQFIDPELEGVYRHSRLGDDLQKLTVFIIIGVVATVYFIPSDILFFGWGETAKWLLLVRAAYIVISIACLIYSFRLTGNHLPTVALLWFSVTIVSQVIIVTNRPPTHLGNFVVELIAILLIYLLLPVTVRRRLYAAGLLTLFGLVVLFFGRDQQPQEMARALAFAAILANFTGIFVSYRYERLDRLKYYLLRSEQAARTELAEANAELDAFSHTVAHDLKNPINALSGGLHLLREEVGDSSEMAPAMEIVELMEGVTLRQQRIVNDLLLLANIRRGQEPPTSSIDMDSSLRKAIGLLQTEVENAGATIEVPEQLPAACGHESWIEQVWVNYLTNAIKYGGNPPRIECGGRSEDDVSYFWVRDHGPGVPEEQQDRLFTEFTQLNQVKVGGHGLGLSVARRIVNALGGNVGMKNVDGGGAEFWFTLPLHCGEL